MTHFCGTIHQFQFLCSTLNRWISAFWTSGHVKPVFKTTLGLRALPAPFNLMNQEERFITNRPSIHLFNLKFNIPILEQGPFLILDNWTFPACLPLRSSAFSSPFWRLKVLWNQACFVVVILSHKKPPSVSGSDILTSLKGNAPCEEREVCASRLFTGWDYSEADCILVAWKLIKMSCNDG